MSLQSSDDEESPPVKGQNVDATKSSQDSARKIKEAKKKKKGQSNRTARSSKRSRRKNKTTDKSVETVSRDHSARKLKSGEKGHSGEDTKNSRRSARKKKSIIKGKSGKTAKSSRRSRRKTVEKSAEGGRGSQENRKPDPTLRTQDPDEDEVENPPKVMKPKTTEQPTKKEALKPKSLMKGLNDSSIIDFVNSTLDRGAYKIMEEFRDMVRTTDVTSMTAFTMNPTKNRYKDVGCFDCSRVILQRSSNESDYINANFVNGVDNTKHYICTQAPLESTTADFWLMVVQQKCAYIIQLCDFVEGNKNKCFQYMPTNIMQPIAFEKISVCMLTNEKARFHQDKNLNILMKSKFVVKVPGLREHHVTHYHWLNWPDRGVPPVDLTPIELFRKVQVYPVLIHCSAGIGRTGCIALIYYLMELREAGIPWKSTLIGYLKELRAQRNNSVQTDLQYLYIHQVVLNWAINQFGLGAKDQTLLEKFKKFSADYAKLTGVN